MTLEPEQPVPAAPAEAPNPPPVSTPALPSKSIHRNVWIIAGLSLAIVCLCTGVCLASIGVGGFAVYSERAPIETVLDSYMQAMAAKDAAGAYALFSPRAQRQVDLATVEALLNGNNYLLFEDYQSLSVKQLNISAAVNTNPDLPQGRVAKVGGTIMYAGGIQGSFKGVLEKVNDTWRLHSIYVTVPPDKIK